MVSRDNSNRKKIIFALLLVPMLSSLPALAAPPPGVPEVTNTYCSTWNNGTGICDDYNFAHDITPASEWVRSRYNFVMHNTTTITMTLEWELHEFNKSAIGLENMDLGGGFDINNSGAPVDYIRNYFGYTTSSGLQVRQMILNEFSSNVEQFVNETYNGSAEVESQIVNEVTIEGQNIACSEDMNADSIDETLGLSNNAFQPPLCLRSVAQIVVGEDLLNLSDGDLDVERAFQGLLTMGASVTSDFTLISRPGHRSTFELEPPSYSTISDVGGNGTLVPHSSGGYDYNSASWMTDGTADSGDGNVEMNASITNVYRNTSTSSVAIDTDVEKGITIYATADMRDPDNNQMSAEMDIHYLPRSVLDDWGFTLGSGNIDLPWITSDGIRMAHEYGLMDLDNFTDMVPLGDVETAVFNATDVEIQMNPATWKSPDSSGGLNFTHSPGTTCSELTVVSHCLQGANAMGIQYPVTLTTSSEPFVADPLEKIIGLINQQEGMENITDIPQEDVAALLSILVYNYDLNTSFISDALPDWLPPTDIEMKIILPEWIASNSNDPRTITLHATSGGGEEVPIAITGPNPYHRRWSDPICESSATCSDSSKDLICKSDWRSCLSVHAELNLPSFEIHEWSQEIELVVEGEVQIDIYRIAVPEVLVEEYGIEVEAIPSDLVRHLIAYGDEQDGGLNGLLGETLEVPLGDTTHQLEISNDGLQAFADSIASMMNSEVANMQHSDDMLTVDLGALRFSASIDRMERPYSGIIDDSNPLTVSIRLERTNIAAKYYDGGVVINTSPGYGAIPSFIDGMRSLFDGRAASDSGGVVTVPPEPVTVEVQPVAMVEDVSSDKDSDLDGNFDNDDDISIRPAITIELTMPKGLEIEFSSSLGRDEQSFVDGGRKKIIYRVPLCTAASVDDCAGGSDEISLQFTVGYAFILQELMPYILGLILLLVLLIYSRRQKKKRKKAAKLEKMNDVRAVSVNTHAVERDLLGLQPSYGGGSAPAGGADDWFDGIDLNDDFR